MIDDMRIHNLSPLTQTSYVGHVSLFARHFGRSPEVLEPEDIRAYLRADPTEKLNAIEAALPPDLRRGVFQVDDRLIAWLFGKKISGVDPWPEPVTERPPAPHSP
jgi:hypothetical protein